MAAEEEDGLAEAVGLFNAGRYFEAHEALERLWLVAEGSDREFYQGVLQVAVGLHHEARGNRKGGASMLGKGVARLAPFAPSYLGVDVARLLDDVRAFQAAAPDTKRAPKLYPPS